MVPVCVVCTAIAHACDSVLQCQPRCQHRTACTNERTLHQLLGPGQPNAAHLLLRDAAVQETLHVLSIMGKAQRCCICSQAGDSHRAEQCGPSAAYAEIEATTADQVRSFSANAKKRLRRPQPHTALRQKKGGCSSSLLATFVWRQPGLRACPLQPMQRMLLPRQTGALAWVVHITASCALPSACRLTKALTLQPMQHILLPQRPRA